MPEEVLVEHAAGAAETAHEGGIHVAIAAERIGEFFGFPITNTLIATWLAMLALVAVGFFVGRSLKLTPSRFQSLLEQLVEYVYDYVAETLESRELAHRFFPLLLTIFLFVWVANLMEFLPGVGSILYHGEPLFRSVNTDLTTPLVLAFVSFFVIEITGILAIGIVKYGSKFIQNPITNPIGFAIGIVEFIGELVRVVSLSFRLFGNILAGEVVIAVALFFSPYLLPVPLMMFEIFIGTLQAAVFALLTLFFIKLAITEPHEAH